MLEYIKEVVEIGDDTTVYILSDEGLEERRRIHQAEWHYSVFEVAILAVKGCLHSSPLLIRNKL